MPVNILIRDVPDEVREALARSAHEKGQSMQAYLQDVLSAEARLSRNLGLIDAVRATIDSSVVEPTPDDWTTDYIRAQRQERSDQQMRVLTEGRDTA